MSEAETSHKPLVQEILDVFKAKYAKMNTVDRNLVVVASIEAIAWIAATEAVDYSKINGLGAKEAHSRFADYNYLFTISGSEGLKGNQK